jgi:hypothetical protein
MFKTLQIPDYPKFYLEYIKKMWVTGEVDFHAASYA